MTKFCTNRNKQTILIESIPYSNWEIEMVRMNIPADNRSFRQELFSFLSEWFDPADTLLVHTSGSTGKPKELYVEKEPHDGKRLPHLFLPRTTKRRFRPALYALHHAN